MRAKSIIGLILVAFLLSIYLSNKQENVVQKELGDTSPQEYGKQEDPYASQRTHMIEHDIKGRGIADPSVLNAIRRVPRHMFIPEGVRRKAYDDHPLPIGYGQTISQPYIVALMTEALQVDGDDRVFEVGTGSGYQAAVLAETVSEVYTAEIVEPLAEKAAETLARLNYSNVFVRHQDGYFGWKEKAPYDAIIITAAVDHIRPPLIQQLRDGGRLILPLGSTRTYQTLTLVTKEGDNIKTKYITGVVFVPMTGEAQKR